MENKKIMKISEINESEFIKGIRSGKIFVYPTDTIYGVGCDAENAKAVERIKKMKSRDENKPFSVIAPSLEWIKNNFMIDVDLEKYLPGPYTLVLKKKNADFFNHVSDNNTLGIRIPDHPITSIIQKSGKPFITTSVNLSGQSPISSVEEIPSEFEKHIDLILDAGKISGRPSTLVIDGKEVER